MIFHLCLWTRPPVDWQELALDGLFAPWDYIRNVIIFIGWPKHMGIQYKNRNIKMDLKEMVVNMMIRTQKSKHLRALVNSIFDLSFIGPLLICWWDVLINLN